ncbi:MAG TPA: protein kinase [Myxococcota bacterium]|jgi:serine/threonine-protein kinase|nr:protein kinase [Myxococcota bacterium]
MRYCSRCLAAYRTDPPRCPNDGAEVVPSVEDPLVGHDIGGRYKIVKRIANGGMGVIYRAEHLEMGKHFAVKVLYGDVAADEKNVERFKQEARAASRLDHPNIISITDFDRTDHGLLYLVMELLHGEDLYRRVARKGPYDVPRAVSVVRQICRGLGNAHGQGLVHRDLKCENIYLARREETSDFVKILDFGLAHLRDAATIAEGPRDSEIGMVFGTPEYMSPEQALGHTADARSDLYSLGIIFYRLLTGVLPFTAQHPLDVCTQQILDPPRPLQVVRPDVDVPDELEAVLRRLLAKRPEDRYRDAAAVLAALDPFPPNERYGLPSSTVVRRRKSFVPAPRDEPGRGRRGVDPTDLPASELPTGELPAREQTAPRAGRADPTAPFFSIVEQRVEPGAQPPGVEEDTTPAPPGAPDPELPAAMRLEPESEAETSDSHLPTRLRLDTKAIQHLATQRHAPAPETAPPTTSSVQPAPARGRFGWLAWAAGVVAVLAGAAGIVYVAGFRLQGMAHDDAHDAVPTAGAGSGVPAPPATARPPSADEGVTAAALATGATVIAAADGTAAPAATAALPGSAAALGSGEARTAGPRGTAVSGSATATATVAPAGTAAVAPAGTATVAPAGTAAAATGPTATAVTARPGTGKVALSVADASKPASAAPETGKPETAAPAKTGKPGPTKAYLAASSCVRGALAKLKMPPGDLSLDPDLGAAMRDAAAQARAGSYAAATVATAKVCDALKHYDFNRKMLAAKLSAVGKALDRVEKKAGVVAAAPLRGRWNKVAAAMPKSLASPASRRAMYQELSAIAAAIPKKMR